MGLPRRDPLGPLPPSRHPFQFWALLACVLSGFAHVAGFADHDSAIFLLPTWAVYVWSMSLMAGGLLALVAGWWRDRVTGLLLERVGLAAIAGVTPVYATVLFTAFGMTAIVPGTLSYAISIAAVWRVIHIHRELVILKRFIGLWF